MHTSCTPFKEVKNDRDAYPLYIARINEWWLTWGSVGCRMGRAMVKKMSRLYYPMPRLRATTVLFICLMNDGDDTSMTTKWKQVRDGPQHLNWLAFMNQIATSWWPTMISYREREHSHLSHIYSATAIQLVDMRKKTTTTYCIYDNIIVWDSYSQLLAAVLYEWVNKERRGKKTVW